MFASSFLARENVVTTSVPGAQASTLCTKAICNGPRFCSQQPLVPQHGRCSDGLTSRVQSLVLKQDPGCCPVGVHVSKVSDTHSLVNIFVSVPKQHDYSKALEEGFRPVGILGWFFPSICPSECCQRMRVPWHCHSLDGAGVSKRAGGKVQLPPLPKPRAVCHSSMCLP